MILIQYGSNETQKYRRYPNVLDVESSAANFFHYHFPFHPAIKNKKKV